MNPRHNWFCFFFFLPLVEGNASDSDSGLMSSPPPASASAVQLAAPVLDAGGDVGQQTQISAPKRFRRGSPCPGDGDGAWGAVQCSPSQYSRNPSRQVASGDYSVGVSADPATECRFVHTTPTTCYDGFLAVLQLVPNDIHFSLFFHRRAPHLRERVSLFPRLVPCDTRPPRFIV